MAEDKEQLPEKPSFTFSRRGRPLEDNPENTNQRPAAEPIDLLRRQVAKPVEPKTPDTSPIRVGRFGNRINELEPVKLNPDPPTLTFVPDKPKSRITLGPPLQQQINDANASSSEPEKIITSFRRFGEPSETAEQIREREQAQERTFACVQALKELQFYLDQPEAELKTDNMKDILSFLETLPLRNGDIFEVPENRPLQRASAVVVVPVGRFLPLDPDNTPFDGVRTSLRDKAETIGVPNPESYVAQQLQALLGLRNTLDRGNVVKLDVRRAFGEEIPLPDTLAFVNTSGSIFAGDVRDFTSTVNVTESILEQLAPDFSEISLPPFNVRRIDPSLQGLAEFLLAFSAGSLVFGQKVIRENPNVDPGDITTSPLQYVELVVPESNYDLVAQARNTLIEVLRKKLSAT